MTEHEFNDYPLSRLFIELTGVDKVELGPAQYKASRRFAGHDMPGYLQVDPMMASELTDKGPFVPAKFLLIEAVLHEICHWLVASERERRTDNYGVSSAASFGDTRDHVVEVAACELQCDIMESAGLPGIAFSGDGSFLAMAVEKTDRTVLARFEVEPELIEKAIKATAESFEVTNYPLALGGEAFADRRIGDYVATEHT